MSITPDDEGTHEPGADEAWQESVYLAWRDPVCGLGGNHRIGIEPKRATSNLWCGVYADSGVGFRHNDEGVPLIACERGRGLECGPQALFHDGEALRMKLDGEGCELDLTIQDLPGSVAWIERADNALDGRIYSDHYNGHCRVRGQAMIDGQRLEVDAAGWRDHSWGVRHWDSILCTRSLGGGFDCGATFSLLTFLGTDGKLLKRGYLNTDGERRAMQDVELWVEIEEDGISARGGGLVFTTADDERRELDFRVTGGMLGVTRERCGFESIVRVAMGNEVGWGFLEINNNPRLGTAGPFAALRNGLENGLTMRSPSTRTLEAGSR